MSTLSSLSDFCMLEWIQVTWAGGKASTAHTRLEGKC